MDYTRTTHEDLPDRGHGLRRGWNGFPIVLDLLGMLAELSERVARIEGYVSALSFFTGAEPLSNVPHSRTRPGDQALSA